MNFQFSIFNFQFLVIFLLIFCLILPSFAFAQASTEVPKTLEEAKEIGERALETVPKELPGIMERFWEEEVLPVWQKMYDWIRNYWKNTAWPRIRGFWENRIKAPIQKEAEKRKEIMKERIGEEKEKITDKIIPESIKSLWARFQELIK